MTDVIRPGALTPAIREPHHDGSPLYVSNSAPALGESVRVRVRVPGGLRAAARACARARTPTTSRTGRDRRRIGTRPTAGTGGRPTSSSSNPRARLPLAAPARGRPRRVAEPAAGLAHDRDAATPRTSRSSPIAPPPAWLLDAVMYQVFPDRFARSAAADDRATPAWAMPAAWDDPVDAVMPGALAAVLRRRPRRRHRAARPPRLARRRPALPDAGLPGARPTTATTRRASTDVDPLLGGDEAYVRSSRRRTPAASG